MKTLIDILEKRPRDARYMKVEFECVNEQNQVHYVVSDILHAVQLSQLNLPLDKYVEQDNETVRIVCVYIPDERVCLPDKKPFTLKGENIWISPTYLDGFKNKTNVKF